MTRAVDHTHDPEARSWIDSANEAGTDFPIQNLPLGIFSVRGGRPRVGIAIGDQVLDVAAATDAGGLLFPDLDAVGRDVRRAIRAETLNPLMALGRPAARVLRHTVFEALVEGALKRTRNAISGALHPLNRAELFLPAEVGDYTDFYASIHHATNVGSMFRPDNPLLPNYKHVPIGYHGRASSIVASGSKIRRPHGQTRDDASAPPQFGPSRRMDYELEVGVFIGPGNALGQPVPIARATEQIFGLALVNDWSARDIQTWEYQPLGPFLAKNFATSVGPWVVTLDALAPFSAPAFARAEGDPAPLPYLADPADQQSGGFDITLEVWLSSARMRSEGAAAVRLSRGSFTDMYWTLAQLVAHHTSNGCNLRTGDLLASGTVSGQARDARGCLLELTWRGSEPVELPTGESRKFLEDGDEVTIRGFCEREGARRIGFGECRGTIVSA